MARLPIYFAAIRTTTNLVLFKHVEAGTSWNWKSMSQSHHNMPPIETIIPNGTIAMSLEQIEDILGDKIVEDIKSSILRCLTATRQFQSREAESAFNQLLILMTAVVVAMPDRLTNSVERADQLSQILVKLVTEMNNQYAAQ